MKPFIYLLLLTLSSMSIPITTTPRVAVEGRFILVNGERYIIKGICYHPVPKGSTQREFDRLDEDLALMQEAGINTLRVYAPIDDRNVLDKIDAAGIKIIMGFGYNQNGFYDILSGTVIDYVKKYKDHPAILLWELGNEYNYHPEWFGGDINNWYTALDKTAAAIQAIDTHHPVASAHGELPSQEVLSKAPHVAVWGMNVYRWDVPGPIFKQWEKQSNKPMYLAEAGADSYMKIAKSGYAAGKNEKAQAHANTKIIDAVFENNAIGSGVLVFSFTDGWWKAGNPATQDVGGWAPNSSGVPYDGAPNEEYWGIVDIDRNKKETFFVLKNKFNAPTEQPDKPEPNE